MWWCQCIDWLKFETRPSSLLNFRMAYWGALLSRLEFDCPFMGSSLLNFGMAYGFNAPHTNLELIYGQFKLVGYFSNLALWL